MIEGATHLHPQRVGEVLEGAAQARPLSSQPLPDGLQRRAGVVGHLARRVDELQSASRLSADQASACTKAETKKGSTAATAASEVSDCYHSSHRC